MKKYILVGLAALFVTACGSDTRLFQQAKLATSKGNYQKALSLYNQLIKHNPQHAAALTNRGLLWEMMPAKTQAEKNKNRQFAEADYLRSLDANPNQPETYNNLGALYMEQNRNGDAIQYFSEAIERSPSYFRALVNRATAYSKVGDLTQALQDFATAAQQRPHDPALLFNRALAYFDANKYEQAIDDLSHAIAVQPQNTRLYIERARVFMKAGYPAEAYDDLTQAIALKPQEALSYYYLGDLMYRNGDKDFALGALVKAKELAPKYVPAYDLMGDMLAAEDPVAATANYLVAVKLDPQNAAKYRRKIEMMKTAEGRYRITTTRFFPQGRAYNAQGQRFVARPVPTGAQTATTRNVGRVTTRRR
ncbi:MAG: tetratricopeptide repeat protein [Elusimicrobiaceae bacterium]|nr:tetratricopeptide repeat protein [Elusimicrobiaceae bacterium]